MRLFYHTTGTTTLSEPITTELSLSATVLRVKTRPRFRAHKMREVILAEAARGCDYEDVRSEFFCRYGVEPSRNLMTQQVTLLLRDGRIVRVRQGYFKLAPAPALSIFD